jgi:hypothetical protein
MKVRGRRNKTKLHARFPTVTRMRVRALQVDPYTVRFFVDPNGTHIVEQTITRDGFGRIVRARSK